MAAVAAPSYGAGKLANVFPAVSLLQVLVSDNREISTSVRMQTSVKHTASRQQQVVYLSKELASWKCWVSNILAAATGSICCKAPAEVAIPRISVIGNSACVCIIQH